MKYIQTEIIQVDPIHPQAPVIEHAATLLRAGQVVVFPTETVYGLGADAFQAVALERIFTAKERPFNDPLIVHIAYEDALELLTTNVPETAKQLAHAFWPGPLTLILPRGPRVPDLVTAGLKTVAIRMPRHAVALALIRAVGSPIAAPSANRFMHVSPTTARHALADLAVESTVLDLCSAVPTILRPGGVSLEALRSVLPDVRPPLHSAHRNINKVADLDRAQKAPGQLLTHYAPAIPLLLFDGSVASMRSAMLAEVRRRREQGERVGVLVADDDVDSFADSGALIYTLGNANASVQIASALFAGLRALEDAHVDVILCRNFDAHGLGLAIRDRLLKAAGGKVFNL
jgi:L-threonylcarbamoyladenylate synthase